MSQQRQNAILSGDDYLEALVRVLLFIDPTTQLASALRPFLVQMRGVRNPDVRFVVRIARAFLGVANSRAEDLGADRVAAVAAHILRDLQPAVNRMEADERREAERRLADQRRAAERLAVAELARQAAERQAEERRRLEMIAAAFEIAAREEAAEEDGESLGFRSSLPSTLRMDFSPSRSSCRSSLGSPIQNMLLQARRARSSPRRARARPPTRKRGQSSPLP